ncbi:MAG: hypothetical protein E7317_06740 [Clostridiales bacterium]|nr:hypothetical protein [Clostridiales bacterium]
MNFVILSAIFVQYINPYSFRYCSALEWITIPESIKSYLGTNAFSDCGTIRVIFPKKPIPINAPMTIHP